MDEKWTRSDDGLSQEALDAISDADEQEAQAEADEDQALADTDADVSDEEEFGDGS